MEVEELVIDAWTRILRAVSLAPGVVVSTVVWLMAAALLPSGLGNLLLLGGLSMLAVLWLARSGRPGQLVDRVSAALAGAREPTQAELGALAPVLSRLADLEVDQMRWLVSRSPRPYPPVRPFGRDQVVVSPMLVEAVFRRQVGVEEAAALIAHAIGWLRAQPTRGDVAIAAWTLPWRALSAVIGRVGAAARWVPLVGFAWRLRFVVGEWPWSSPPSKGAPCRRSWWRSSSPRPTRRWRPGGPVEPGSRWRPTDTWPLVHSVSPWSVSCSGSGSPPRT